MSTTTYPLVRQVADGWEHLYPSAVCSGIVGDLAHQERGGYHIGRDAQSTRNYSVIRTDDRSGMGPSDASSAIDMTLSRADMILCTRRLMGVWENLSDPRRKYLNAFNGYLGTGPAIRLDMVSGRRGTASPDHKWHIHLEIRRRWVEVASMVTAVISILSGESVAQYMKKIGVNPVTSNPAAVTATAKGPTVPAYPGRVLQQNAAGKPDAAVRTWQARMIARGWKSIGTADGVFGPKTETVVLAFQRQCKVSADGKIGPITWPLPWTHPMGS